MKQPEGNVDADRPTHVCKLGKALYGLKQSPRLWHKKIDDYLIRTLQFATTTGDPCMYLRRRPDSILIIALYVNDLLIAGNDMSAMSWIKGELSKRST